MADEVYLRRHREEIGQTNAVITPICIVVDVSKSMALFKDGNGLTRMDRLNDGMRQFLAEVKADDMLCDSVEISIVTFGIDAELAQKFTTIENINGIELFAGKTAGDTPKGVEMALQVLEAEKQFLKTNRRKYNQPWLVLFSDGRATPLKDPITGRRDFTDINNRLDEAQTKTRELEKNQKLTVIPVLISEPTDKQFYAAKNQMKGFSAKNRALNLGDSQGSLSFKDFFKVLSRSVSVSNADLMFQDGKVEQRDQLRTYNANDYKKPSDVSGYLRRVGKSINNENSKKEIQMSVLLPQEIDDNECVKISYNPAGTTPGDWVELYSDSDEVHKNGISIRFSATVNKDISTVEVYVGIHSKIDHSYKRTLINNPYTITNNMVRIVLSEFNGEESIDIEQLKAEAFSSMPILETKEDFSFEIEAEKPLPKAQPRVDTSTADDEYLKALLEGLDDWDNI